MTEMTEDPLGIMLYGYGVREASLIRGYLSDVFGREVILLSASGREDTLVQDILQSPSDSCEENDVKVLMFLGFDDEQISRALSEFPKDGTVVRPIFCGLTEQNITWPLKQLLEHLMEEERYWKGGGASSGVDEDSSE